MQKTGVHNLPLIGEGDWNDGMNRVGEKGRGESVWLAWFQICNVRLFQPIASYKGDVHHKELWGNYAAMLMDAIRLHAWDGDWFVRAFDDDGVKLGSRENKECQIDSIAQSWAVIADAHDGQPMDGSDMNASHSLVNEAVRDPLHTRIQKALASANERLVRGDKRLIYLLDPPFEHSSRDPGYIMSYPPGVRENGGQYTHAAAWLGIANARLGNGDMAWKIFDIINPIRRTLDKSGASQYRREPYVLPGDVAGVDAMTGRGGWTWYTGAASWSWQLGVHEILGIRYEPGCVVIKPCLPRRWEKVDVKLQQNDAIIQLAIIQLATSTPRGHTLNVDGNEVAGNRVPFPDRGKTCRATLTITISSPL